MPKKDNVGHGEFTGLKMEILGKIFDMHLAVTQAVLRKYPSFRQIYRYFDLTAGKGYVPDSTIPGSPLVFLNSVHAESLNMLFEAHLIECNDINFQELQLNIGKYAKLKGWDLEKRIGLYKNKYEEIVPSILGATNNREFGLFFIDHSGDLPNFETINLISQKRPRMEILIYLPARNIKRLHHLTNKSLLDYMKEIGKSNWLIRKPISWDNLEWTFLLGSNTDIFKNYKDINFFKLESEEAQNFFPKLNLTSKERMEKIQPRLL